MLCEQLDHLLTIFKQSKENLDKPCCDNLFETLKTEIPSFEVAAPYFGFKEPEIVELRSDFSYERQRRLQMLWKWKAKNGSDATYLAIVQVFLKMGNKQLAECVLGFCCREKEVPSIDSHVNPSKVKKYQNWESMSNFEREKITNKLHVENQEIRIKYSFLVDNFLTSLQKREIEVNRLKLFLTSYSGVPQVTLLNATTLAEVLLIIQTSYSSWFNIQLFEHIVEQFGSDDDKENMRAYEESYLVPYLQRSIFEMPSKSFGGNETTDRISLGLRLPNEVIPTGQDVAIIKHKLSQHLGITDEILLFIRYDEGSTILIFEAPEALCHIAVLRNMIEKTDTTKRIYTITDDLAQVIIYHY